MGTLVRSHKGKKRITYRTSHDTHQFVCPSKVHLEPSTDHYTFTKEQMEQNEYKMAMYTASKDPKDYSRGRVYQQVSALLDANHTSFTNAGIAQIKKVLVNCIGRGTMHSQRHTT